MNLRYDKSNPQDAVTNLAGMSHLSENDWEEEDFDLDDRNLLRNTVDGMPTLDFSKRLYSLIEKSMSSTIELKLLGKRIGVNTLWSKVCSLWKPTKRFQLMDIENDYFLTKFESHYLTVQPWTTQFSLLQEFLENVVAWIHIPSLSGAFYKRSILRAIGELVGKVVKIVLQTDKGVRGQFARFVVQVNLRKPLISRVRVANRIHRVEYESLPMICFRCGTYGHMKENYTKVHNTESMEEESDTANENFLRMKQQPEISTQVRVEKEEYGEWMIVDRQSC
ncbi:hypothetical protein Gotri_004234 [Gossypium trilobum]|uniref:CCHC-type domain-containing protein n=1 Tax=Gossypium trilobum TaxID=34281 RepID=A0A7J9F584_9ROSI|nr:hypothetical protein [Gossypium trilobum]